jgi:hypothetical protein
MNSASGERLSPLSLLYPSVSLACSNEVDEVLQLLLCQSAADGPGLGVLNEPLVI